VKCNLTNLSEILSSCIRANTSSHFRYITFLSKTVSAYCSAYTTQMFFDFKLKLQDHIASLLSPAMILPYSVNKYTFSWFFSVTCTFLHNFHFVFQPLFYHLKYEFSESFPNSMPLGKIKKLSTQYFTDHLKNKKYISLFLSPYYISGTEISDKYWININSLSTFVKGILFNTKKNYKCLL